MRNPMGLDLVLVRRELAGHAFDCTTDGTEADPYCDNGTGNALNRRKHEQMRSIVSSMLIKGRWSGKVWSTGFCAKRSKRRKPSPMPRSRSTSNSSGKPTTRATKNLPACEKYCREQRELLRALEDLDQQEREMYELDNRKDQVMTIFKVALANLGL